MTHQISCIICKEDFNSKSFTTHYLHNHDSAWKQTWLERNKTNSGSGSEVLKQQAEKRKKTYEDNPKICFCGKSIPWVSRNNKSCSRSCAGILSNRSREKMKEETKEKISNSLKKNRKNFPKRTGNYKKYCSICFYNCSQCDKIMYSRSSKPRRKTCSRECQINASTWNRTYINGKRKNIYYVKKSGGTVLLESSWEEEIAKFLDENDIEWIRPKYINWVDDEGKTRNYYPDFYLKEFDLYLDPKNPYGMKMEKEKMIKISKIVRIIYGDKEMIKEKLLNLIRNLIRNP